MSEQACINPITDPINTCSVPPSSSASSPALTVSLTPFHGPESCAHLSAAFAGSADLFLDSLQQVIDLNNQDNSNSVVFFL